MLQHSTLSTRRILRVAYKGERIVLERHGKDVAALVSVEDLELLEELEDRTDLAGPIQTSGRRGDPRLTEGSTASGHREDRVTGGQPASPWIQETPWIGRPLSCPYRRVPGHLRCCGPCARRPRREGVAPQGGVSDRSVIPGATRFSRFPPRCGSTALVPRGCPGTRASTCVSSARARSGPPL